MNITQTPTDTYALHYLASLHGKSYSEEAGRTFERLRNPKKYEDFHLAPSVNSSMDVGAALADGRRIFVASDHHYGHRNIIKYADRPFSLDNVSEMNEYMIQRHNSVVKPTDIIFLLGDIAFCDIDKANEYLDRMNGYKILIIGNHDWQGKDSRIKRYKVDEMHVTYTLTVSELPFSLMMSHAPFDSYLLWTKNIINMHGHIHQHTIDHWRYANFCVECIDYTPVNFVDFCTEMYINYRNRAFN